MAELQQVLSAEAAPLPERSARRADVPLRKYPDLWAHDQGEEEGIPAAFCLGPGRRPLAPQESLDLQLVVLEAAARRRDPAPDSLWLDASRPERHEWVRWTASRIASQLRPELALPPDPSPLVQGARQRQQPGPPPGEPPPG